MNTWCIWKRKNIFLFTNDINEYRTFLKCIIKIYILGIKLTIDWFFFYIDYNFYCFVMDFVIRILQFLILKFLNNFCFKNSQIIYLSLFEGRMKISSYIDRNERHFKVFRLWIEMYKTKSTIQWHIHITKLTDEWHWNSFLSRPK